MTQERVQTWDLATSAMAEVVRPKDEAAVAAALADATERDLQVCVRGGGHSIGDVAILNGGVVLDTTGVTGVRHFDPDTGEVVCAAGTTIAEILALGLPTGWRTVGMSGSAFDTLGGALASNTHGRDSWWAGHFAENVTGFRMMTADGATREVDRETDPELFHAVTGGLGMLGVVVEVRLRLTRIPSVAVEESASRCADFDALVSAMHAFDPSSGGLCQAEVEQLRTGKGLGGSVLHVGRFTDDRRDAEVAAIPDALRRRTRIFGLPEAAFWSIARRVWTPTTYRLAGLAARRAYLRGSGSRRILFPTYWYPHLRLPGVSRLFLPSGAIELQACAPWDSAADAFRALLGVLEAADRSPWLCVVRRLRPSPSPLTFADEGLAMTCVVAGNGLESQARAALLARFSETLLAHGGRLYLTKSPWASAEVTQQMYPRATEILALKARLDPDSRLASDATRRLFGT